MRKNVKRFIKENICYNLFLFAIILIGIFLRSKGFFGNSSFWHDECGLAWNIRFKTYAELFGILKFLQVTPPLFMVFTKFLTSIFGFSEFIFRLIPYLAGCCSIFFFYMLACETLNKKFSILLATFLYAINKNLINYSFEFKPYITDVLISIMSILFFIKLDLERLTTKKIILYGFLIAVLPWFSFISMFIIASGFLNLLFKNFYLWKKKLALIFPTLISCLIYLKFYIINNYTGTQMVSDWQNYFINNNIGHVFWLFIRNINYFFEPIRYILFAIILLIWGITLLYKEKSLFLNISLYAIILLIIASILHIYPFAERLILFLFPILLLLITKPLDSIYFNNKIKSTIIIILFTLAFYPQIIQVKNIFQAQELNRDEYAREMMKSMVKKLKPTDIIFVNNPSEAEFAYYYSFYKKDNKYIQEKMENLSTLRYKEELNHLKKGYYWFYLPIDYVNAPVLNCIEDWAQSKEIIYKYKIGQKYPGLLMYVHIK